MALLVSKKVVSGLLIVAKKSSSQKKSKNCTKGYSCGASCISRTRNCRRAVEGEAKNYAEWLQKNLGSEKLSPFHKKQAEELGVSADAPPEAGDSIPPLSSLEYVKTLGGSTGARLMRDPTTGKEYVVKKGSSEGHLLSEALADDLYEALGIAVPRHRVDQDEDGRSVKIAEFVQGRMLNEIYASGDEDLIARVERAVQDGFAIDAALGNWDVIGMSRDNILVANDGTVYRIDNGGALAYRAQGSLKTTVPGGEFNNFPTEIWSLRDSKINAMSASVFNRPEPEAPNQMSIYRISEQIRNLSQDQIDAALSKVGDPGMRATLEARFAEMKRMSEIVEDFKADNWNEEYTNEFARQNMQIRQAGVFRDAAPRVGVDSLQDWKDNQGLFDDAGVRYDNLRSNDAYDANKGFSQAFADYASNNGVSIQTIHEWTSSQSGDSWSTNSLVYKDFVDRSRPSTNEDGYFYTSGARSKLKESLTNTYDRMTAGKQEEYARSMIAHHAMTYESLRAVELPNVDRNNRTLTVHRTETSGVLGLDPRNEGSIDRARNDEPRRILSDQPEVYIPARPVFDSTSLITAPEPSGRFHTRIENVPLHRVLASWTNKPMYGDNENEMVVMLEGSRQRLIGFNLENRYINRDGEYDTNIQQDQDDEF